MAEKPDEKTIEQLNKIIAQGEQLLNSLDFKGAISKFNKAIKLVPEDPRGYFNKAEASVGIPKLTSPLCTRRPSNSSRTLPSIMFVMGDSALTMVFSGEQRPVTVRQPRSILRMPTSISRSSPSNSSTTRRGYWTILMWRVRRRYPPSHSTTSSEL